MLCTLLKPIASSTGRRFMASAVQDALLPKAYQNQTFRAHFLSDPSTYPLIVILTATSCLIVGMSANALNNYKGLRIKPSSKHDVIPVWDGGQRYLLTEVLARNPMGFHADGLKAIRYEGLGVDHKEWIKKTQE